MLKQKWNADWKTKQREKIKRDVVELVWRYLFVRFRSETEKRTMLDSKVIEFSSRHKKNNRTKQDDFIWMDMLACEHCARVSCVCVCVLEIYLSHLVIIKPTMRIKGIECSLNIHQTITFFPFFAISSLWKIGFWFNAIMLRTNAQSIRHCIVQWSIPNAPFISIFFSCSCRCANRLRCVCGAKFEFAFNHPINCRMYSKFSFSACAREWCVERHEIQHSNSSMQTSYYGPV